MRLACGGTCQPDPVNRTRPSTTVRPPSASAASRMEGTVPSQGGRGRSLNQHEVTPCSRIRTVRVVMSAAVIGESWASSAIVHPPPGSVASTSARQEPSGARTSISAWAPHVPGRAGEFELEEVVGLGLALSGDLAVGRVRGMSEEP